MSKTPPVLFIIFNRPETTAQVWEAIRAAKPQRLYVSADGPRTTKSGEVEKCAACRQIVSAPDWDCEVKYNFLSGNHGCRRGVNAALDFFFSHEEEGIILEDDCLPHPDFFRYAALMLSHYRNDERIMHINGSNCQNGIRRGEGDIYFSRCVSVWGWASWRRAWLKNDRDLQNYNFTAAIDKTFRDREKRSRWHWILKQIRDKNPNFDTWDFQWNASIFANDAYVITPQENLVMNIGLNCGGSHQMDQKRFFVPHSVNGFPETPAIPENISANEEADDIFFRTFLKKRNIFQRIIDKLCKH